MYWEDIFAANGLERWLPGFVWYFGIDLFAGRQGGMYVESIGKLGDGQEMMWTRETRWTKVRIRWITL